MMLKYVKNFKDFNLYGDYSIFSIFTNETEMLTSSGAIDINKKLVNFILKNIFSEVFIINDRDICQDVNNLPQQSMFYCFKPFPIYDLENIPENEKSKVDIFYKCLKNRLDLYTFFNNNMTSSKLVTHRLFLKEPFFPKTVCNINDIDDLKFPIVAKPDFGHSGLGIKKFDNKKELMSTKDKQSFDVFSEYVKFEREYRAIFVKNELIYLAERIAREDKNISIDNKEKNDKMAFAYVAQDINKFKKKQELLKINEVILGKLSDLSVYSIDFFLTTKDELKVIEINSQTGLDPYRLLTLYETLYKISFDKSINFQKKQLIKKLKDIFLYYQYSNFKNEIAKSLNPINYVVNEIDKELLELIEKEDTKKIFNDE